MKKKKIMIITTIVSFLLVTALSMQFSSEKAVNDESQLVQKRTEVNPNGTTSIVRSAVLPGSSTTQNESKDNREFVLEQTYTEVNPNVYSVMP